ncbi:MAG TPA: MATE family efflux transporter [Geminicoccaceae bacterium]|nr:MATE family efflux transporter [Geminicoccaceae bacterium]
MSLPSAGLATPALPGRAVRDEIRATARLGVPLALAQVGQIAINTTDVLILGRLSPEALASASLAMSLFHPSLLFAIGVVTAVSPLVAQALGARRPREVRRAVRQGLWVTVAVALPLMALLWFVRPILAALGQDPAVLDGSATFMHAFVWGLPGAVGFVVLRCFVTGFGRTRAVIAITLMGVLVNAVLNWGLVFGRFGLPRLELMGSGMASSIVNTAMFLALLAYAVRARPFRRYGVLGNFWRPDWAKFRAILRLGVPIGGLILLEVAMFSSAVLLMGLIGTLEVAAHQVTVQIAATAFMVPLGIGHAATIRVALAHGGGDRAAVRRAGLVACGLGTVFTTLSALAFWFLPDLLVAPFLDPANPEALIVAALAVSFLKIAALFQLVDGVQVIAASALRGMSDTRVPMLLAGIGYWLVGFPACALLAFAVGLGGAGIWTGLAIGLGATALLLTARFWRLSA